MSQQQRAPAKCNQCQQEIIFKQEGLKPDGSKKWVRYDYVSPQTKHVCKTLGEPKPEQVAHASVQQEYAQRQDQIQKNFEERLDFDKQRLAFDRENAARIEANTIAVVELHRDVLKLMAQNAATYEQLEILVRTFVDRKDLFKTAAEVQASNLTSEVRQD